MSDLLYLVAETIKHYRKAHNYSQEELASLSGLDRSYISGVETGSRNLTINSLSRIIKALDISLQEFLEELAVSAGELGNKKDEKSL